MSEKQIITVKNSKRMYTDKTGLNAEDWRECPASEIKNGDMIIVNVPVDTIEYKFELHVVDVTGVTGIDSNVSDKKIKFHLGDANRVFYYPNDPVKIVEPKTPHWFPSNEICPNCHEMTQMLIVFELDDFSENGQNYQKAEKCEKCKYKIDFDDC